MRHEAGRAIVPLVKWYFLIRQVRRTTLISIGSAACLVGLALARLGWEIPAGGLLLCAPLLLFCWRKVIALSVPAALLIGLIFGVWRGSDINQRLDWYRAAANQKVALTGEVIQDSTYGNKKQIDFMIGHVRVDDRELPGTVHVTTFSSVQPKQGDIVQATAKLKDGFGSYQAGLYFADVQILAKERSWFARIRHQFSAVILSVIPEPQASLGLGFLLGIKSQLPDELNEQLKIVGLTHIVVASGYNLTILVRAARRLLARRSKYQATLAAVVLMVGFVGVTGLSPSMSRATLVTSLALAAWYYGRVIHPVLLLLFSAAATALANPLFLWNDIGWYLSFLAFGGVMLLAPLLQTQLFGGRKPPQLAQIVLETIAAELVTLPLILWIFGAFSAVGLFANVLVGPLVPLAMLATFAGGVATILLPGVGSWLALPAQWILGYMTSAVEYMAAIPWAQQRVNITLVTMLALYVCVLVVGVLMYRRTRHNYLGESLVE